MELFKGHPLDPGTEEVNRKNLITPRGFYDILPREALVRERIEGAMNQTLSKWGYLPVDPPVLESFDVMALASDLAKTSFKFFDLDGELLVLRPDMTLSIARLASSRFSLDDGLLRLRYCAPVFREHESLRGQARQFTQIGIELIGEQGPSADAEVVLLMIETLKAAGLESFSLSVGTVAVFAALLEASGMDVSWKEAAVEAAHSRDFVSLRSLAHAEGVPGNVGSAIAKLETLRGKAEAIEECAALVRGLGCEDALMDFSRMFSILEESDVADFVNVDFSIMRPLDYYTGIVIEANAPGLGLALGGGGRYDNVLAAYGAPASAAGFAVGIERLLIARSEQGLHPEEASIDVLVGGEKQQAFREAMRLRSEGLTAVVVSGDEDGISHALKKMGATRAVIVNENGEVRSVKNDTRSAGEATR